MQIENLRKLDDESLLSQTRSLVSEERKITTQILRFLQEVQRRRLHTFRGFSSMHEFATQYLGYTDAAAQRRLAAMRVLNEIPEIEKKIEAGIISLSNVAMAQKFFKTEEKFSKPLTLNHKKEVLQKLEGKSTRESLRALVAISSQPEKLMLPDSVKQVTRTQVEVRFVADESLIGLLNQVKGMLAHKNPNVSMAELITEMAKISLNKLQLRRASSAQPQESVTSSNGMKGKPPKNSPTDSGAEVVGEAQSKDLDLDPEKKSRSRYIPLPIKRAVFHRDGGQCTYVDPQTGRRCSSRYALEYNHRIPFAKGGAATIENLELVCQQHNLVLAIQEFGASKMDLVLPARYGLCRS